MKLLIGVAGIKFAGKGEAVKCMERFLGEIGFKTKRINSGLILREALEFWSIPITNKNLQDLFALMTGTRWEGITEEEREKILSGAVRREIEGADADIVIFDGVRMPTDVEMVRSFDRNTIIFIDALIETCRQRTAVRTEKVGEGKLMTLEEFRELMSRKSDAWVPEIKKVADRVISNEGSFDDLEKSIRLALKDLAILNLD